jgi:hypothetical protein
MFGSNYVSYQTIWSHWCYTWTFNFLLLVSCGLNIMHFEVWGMVKVDPITKWTNVKLQIKFTCKPFPI